jgi:DNA-directed RNA polymerase subunit F
MIVRNVQVRLLDIDPGIENNFKSLYVSTCIKKSNERILN